MSERGRAIVSGILFRYPLPGVTYQFLHYLIGLRTLGWDVWYVEDSATWMYNMDVGVLLPDASENIARVAPALERYGFGDRWVFRGRYGRGCALGPGADQLDRIYREADVFLNVTGGQEVLDEHMAIPQRLYVESDPFASQVKVAQGDEHMIRQLDGHHMLFSFGENIGQPGCGVPVVRYEWLTTRQPVALDLWPVQPPDPTAPFTTIATWDNTGKDIEFDGETWYWRKAREFERFLDLPLRRPSPGFELATDVSDEVRDRLVDQGWSVRSAAALSGDIDSYRRYISGSRGEFTVSKEQVVRPWTGWFSDRTACYLAAGRPVITHDTGFGRVLPTGEGLFPFTTMEDILAAADAIAADHERHCRTAREIAEEYFAAETVIRSLLDRAGLNP